jgi:hypothetical protein
LILSHEINELLEDMSDSKHNDDQSDKVDEDDADDYDANSDMLSNTTPMNGTRGLMKSKRSNLSSAGHNTFSKRSSKRNVTNNEEDEDQAMKEYLKKKNELKAA